MADSLEYPPPTIEPVAASQPDPQGYQGELEGAALDPPREDALVQLAQVDEAGPSVTLEDFEALYARFQGPIFGFIFSKVGNREQAADLTQEVFVKVYRALARGDHILAAVLSSWLYRVARNTATDVLRQRSLITWQPLSYIEERGAGMGIAEPASGDDAEAYNSGRFEQMVAERDVIERVLAKLSEKDRQVLLLIDRGFSYPEIGEILGLSHNAVKMHAYRSRRNFARHYNEETGSGRRVIPRARTSQVR